MANNSINLVPLDFITLRNQFKTYLSAQSQFSDYDFDASNLSVLIDLLAYNTFHNAFYLNMIGNEMFLDSAQMRESVVSHAKELGYTPRSNKSSAAVVSLQINMGAPGSVTIPKNTPFIGRIGSNTYTFTTNTAIVSSSTTNTILIENVSLYEGTIGNDVFVYDSGNTAQRFLLSDPNVDTSSLFVTVLENSGANVYTYRLATSLFDLDAQSQVYFLAAAEDGKYEIKFGDGVVGRIPNNGSTISAQYRRCNGDLPNLISVFSPAGNIGGFSNVNIITTTAALGGQYAEGVESIRFNAPRHFATQERAVTASDYETLLKLNFPELTSVSVYGGEEIEPPQYGKVFITPNITGITGLPTSKKIQYMDFIKTRSPLTIEPVFTEPEYLFIAVDSIVNYNLNLTSVDPEFIAALVSDAIITFNVNNIGDFKSTLRYSKLVEAMDDADESIISNDTDLSIYKVLQFTPNTTKNYTIAYDLPLIDNLPALEASHPAQEVHAISSSYFFYKGRVCQLEDNGDGIMRIVADENQVHSTIINVGTVDYATGKIELINFGNIAADNNRIKVYAKTKSKDVASKRNVILTILREDINIDVNQVRE
jgi:hypothetical protein